MLRSDEKLGDKRSKTLQEKRQSREYCFYPKRSGKTENRKKEKNMIEQDTVKLLRECDAGIKMGISSIGDVLGYVKDEKLRSEERRVGKECRSRWSPYH